LPIGIFIKISYMPVYVNFKNTFRNKHDSVIMPEFSVSKDPFKLEYSGVNNNIFGSDGLDITGSIMRGLSIGNNQNAVVNANLNLQFSGKINNDIYVLAAVSDDNNPIQPEGNTQELQDFDQVYIQFSKDSSMLTVGDFLMQSNPASNFMKFYKKSRGVQSATRFNINKNSQINIDANAAISRGRFVRNIINGIEGNQGPYRLTGPNGELFIIIISGTEAVYLDGLKLTRGEQNDYVIDYNTGEITFTAKKNITAYSRIVVEFQFSDRNYARTVFNLNNNYSIGRATYFINYFTEQDNKNQPFQQQLTDSAKKILANAGDNSSRAVISGATISTFSNSKVLYKLIDTAGFNNVFVHAPQKGADSIFYEVRFSYTGTNKGNYKQGASAANGRVFVWVSPLNGVPQGDFEPVVPLASPNKTDMLTLGVQYQVLKNTAIRLEGARTNFNRNLFSTLDKADDVGYGFKADITNIVKNFADNTAWHNQLSYEYVDANFRFIERYRNVEFERIWNRQLVNNRITDTGYQEHILSYQTKLGSAEDNIFYQLGLYNRNNNAFGGLQHQLGYQFKIKNTESNSRVEWLNTVGQFQYQVKRYQLFGSQKILKHIISAQIQTEESKLINDTLLPASFNYKMLQTTIANADSTQLKYFITYAYRLDKTPVNNAFADNTEANEVKSGISVVQKNFNRLNADITFRQFLLKQKTSSNVLPEERTFLARVEYDYGLFSRVVTANTYMVTGSGNELRRDFQFFKVQQGQGVYVWKDFNDDALQQLNEFVPASFADRPQADYIKVILPSSSVIKTLNNQFSQTFNINAPINWQQQKGIKKVLSFFSNQFAARYENKLNRSNFIALSFINLNINDTELISTNAVFRNTLYVNRSNPVYGADITVNSTKTKNQLTNGIESRERLEYLLNVRWNINSSLSVLTAVNTGNRGSLSQFFGINNYRFNYTELKPKFIYQYLSAFRLTLNYTFFSGYNNPSFGSERATINEGSAETRYTIKKVGVLTIKYGLYKVNYSGNITTPLAYDMLQGLGNGNNQLINIALQQRIGSNIQININYDARKSEGLNTIHTGNMEARYLF